MSAHEIAYILRIYCQAECASNEFYAIVDKHIGNHILGASAGEVAILDPSLIYPILKTFYDSGRARTKLFIKM